MYAVSKSICDKEFALQKNLPISSSKTIDKVQESSNLAELSQSLFPEHVLIAIISLIANKTQDITVDSSSIRINVDQVDLLRTLNYSFEFLCQIPFSFEFDAETREYVFDFTHLKKNVNKILNLS